MSSSSKTRAPTSHIPPFGLRMQPDLRMKLEEAAVATGRSMNAEIVARLEASFGQQEQSSEAIGKMFANLIEKAVKTPQFAQALLELREEALKVAPELAEVKFKDGKPVKKRGAK